MPSRLNQVGIFLIVWSLANAIAWLAGLFVGGNVGFQIYLFLIYLIPGALPGTMFPTHPYMGVFALIAFTLVGSILGFCLGLAQWCVMRYWHSMTSVWILMSTLGWSIGAAISYSIVVISGFTMTTSIAAINFMLILGGLANGISTWFVLKKKMRKVGWWIIVNCISSVPIGVILLFIGSISTTYIDNLNLVFLVFLLAGVGGGITGVAIHRILS